MDAPKTVDDVKREIYGEFACRHRSASAAAPSGEEAQKLEKALDVLKEENRHLERRVKDLFAENARLREYVGELEGSVRIEKRPEKKEATWQRMLRLEKS